MIKIKVVDEDDGDEDDGVQDDGEGEWNSCQVKIESLWLLCQTCLTVWMPLTKIVLTVTIGDAVDDYDDMNYDNDQDHDEHSDSGVLMAPLRDCLDID